MIKLRYKITKFDKENLLIHVVFLDDNSWAEIRLAKPLPKDAQELENIIKSFSAPKEAIEARLAPDADLSYIDAMVEVERECDRLVLTPPDLTEQQVTPEIDAELQALEAKAFEESVRKALINLGVINESTT